MSPTATAMASATTATVEPSTMEGTAASTAAKVRSPSTAMEAAGCHMIHLEGTAASECRAPHGRRIDRRGMHHCRIDGRMIDGCTIGGKSGISMKLVKTISVEIIEAVAVEIIKTVPVELIVKAMCTESGIGMEVIKVIKVMKTIET